MTKNDQTQNNIFLKVALSVLACLVLFAGGALSFWFLQEKIIKKPQPLPSPSASSQVTPVPTVEPKVEPEPTVMSEPTPVSTKSDADLLREAFAAKYGHSVSEVILNINKQSNPYASGGVKFSGEIGGAMWLAYKGSDGWIIVFDGHGTIPCVDVDSYGFPADMVPECIDEHGNPITR